MSLGKSDSNTGNFNSGVLNISCLINQYCPFFKNYYTDVTLPFSSDSFESAPDYLKDRYGTVKGVNGLFMKPVFQPWNNFLVWKKTDGAISSDSGNGESSSEELDQMLKDYYISIKGTQEEYEHFLWETTWSLFADRKKDTAFPQRFSNYCKATPTVVTDKNQPVYQYKSNKIDQSSATDRVGLLDSGDVNFISQVATSCGTTGAVHWGVQKYKKLFRGEDFYIEFRKISYQNDPVKKTPTTAMSEKYKGIDVNADIESSALPPNMSLVPYRTQGTGDYVCDAESSPNFNLNNQPYLVVMLSSESSKIDAYGGWYYAILIPYNGNPIFVKQYNEIYSSPGSSSSKTAWVTCSLGSYDVSGASLLAQDILRIAVRNHLGKLIITFSGHEDNPWIIEENPPEVTSKTIKQVVNFSNLKVPPPIAIVPESYLLIYGGNLQTSFMFAPIVYDKAGSVLHLPIERKAQKVSETVNPREPFVFPLESGMQIKLSVREDGIDPSSLLTQSAVYVNKSFYTGDHHSIIGTDDIDTPPYYMDLNDFLKDFSSGSPASIEIVKIPVSSIPQGQGLDIFLLDVVMKAGSHKFDNKFELFACKTPIITILRLVATNHDSPGWQAFSFDAGINVQNITDNWSSSDFHKMDHSATITFLITDTVLGKESIASDGSMQANSTHSQVNAARLRSLATKAFYVQVKAGYDSCNYSDVQGMHNIITGICHGGVITEKAGIKTMQCKIEDYSGVLNNILIFNSPFYDGVRDVNAVEDLLKMAKFRSTGIGPASLISSIVQQTSGANDSWNVSVGTDEGRVSHGRIYALSQSYARLTGGSEWRFNDGEKIQEALYKIAKKSGKVIFFDASGVFHYESFPIDNMVYGSSDSNAGNPYSLPIVQHFTSSPRNSGQLIFNQLTTELAVSDVYNTIHIISGTPNGELIVADDVDTDGIYNPDYEGFLGYMKVMFQKEGLFGSPLAVQNYMKMLKKFNRPPVILKFETFGLPLRCFDIIDVDGQRQIVVSVSSTFDAQENKWWMTVEGEWFHGSTRVPPA